MMHVLSAAALFFGYVWMAVVAACGTVLLVYAVIDRREVRAGAGFPAEGAAVPSLDFPRPMGAPWYTADGDVASEREFLDSYRPSTIRELILESGAAMPRRDQ